MKKYLPRIVLGLAIVVVFFLYERGDIQLAFVRNLESQVSDVRTRLTMPGGVDPQVVILDIDEKSLKEREDGGEGRWPWPRDRLALMMDKLFDKHQIAVLGFDIVFAERDKTSGAQVLERLAGEDLKNVPPFQTAFNRIRAQLDYDAIFASKLKGRKVVLGYTFNHDSARKGLLPPPVLASADLGGHKIPQKEWSGYSANIEILQNTGVSGGHFNPDNEADGVLRRVPMLVQFQGKFYE